MRLLYSALIVFYLSLGGNVMANDIADKLDNVIAGTHRAPTNVTRNIYRHPKETLLFFDLQPNMTVLEILPGLGWYTEILAPLLMDSGKLTAASFGDQHQTKYLRNLHIKFMKKINADPNTYGNMTVIPFEQSGYLTEVADESQDMVVTFRNTHNWIRFGGVKEVYAAFNRVLKPGGVLGVVQHRAKAGDDHRSSAKRGYVPEKYLIKLAESNGFELVKKSEINANPADVKDYPEGVWSLPPSLREEDKNREKYMTIGESDRMTMKFIKIK